MWMASLQTFMQATAGHGGWPTSVWLTPDLKPFVGGTYFPPEDRFGHPGQKSAAADRRGPGEHLSAGHSDHRSPGRGTRSKFLAAE